LRSKYAEIFPSVDKTADKEFPMVERLNGLK